MTITRTSTRSSTLLTAAIIAICLLMTAAAGCGGESSGQSDSTETSSVVVSGATSNDFLLVDCSGSFVESGLAQTYLDEMVAFAADSAKRRNRLSWACIDGGAERTAHTDSIDFTDLAERADLTLEEDTTALLQASAAGVRSKLEKLLSNTPEIKGTLPSEALKVASRRPNLKRIAMWSDGLPSQRIGFDIATASPQQLEASARRWAGRMDLSGVTVIVVGGGRGARSPKAARNAESLMRQTVELAGGHIVWTDSLPQLDNDGLPVEGGETDA